MLRTLVIALLLANLAWWAAHWPPLAEPLGLASPEREPQRLARQQGAEQIRLLPDAPASRPAEPAPVAAAAPACLEAGPLDDAGFQAARGALQQAGVGSEAWVEIRRELPGSFAIYMGRFADAEQARHKAEELQRLGVPHELATGALAPGLLLGRYTDAGQAQAGLNRLQNRGVRTARLQTLLAPAVEHRLKLERLDDAARTRLQAGPSAALWRACP